MIDNAALLAALVHLIRPELAKDGWWVPIDDYLALHKGESAEAVKTRRSKGIWRDGVESKYLKGAGLWVNLIAVNEWAAKSELRQVSASGERAAGSPAASA